MIGVEYASATREGQGIAGMAVFPDYYLGPFAPEAPPPAALIPPQQRPRLPRSSYPAIAERARHESLRDLAAEHGVSHETIRAIVRRVGRLALVAAAACTTFIPAFRLRMSTSRSEIT